MVFTKPFKELSKNDANIAGGKGASLGEMTQVGIPVPPGFVVLSASFDHFIERNNLGTDIETILRGVNQEDSNSAEDASSKIQKLILDSPIPKDIEQETLESFTQLDAQYVAVRSSATAEDSLDASWAGELESYLNITENDLLTSVRKCWASLFTPRAIFYRIEKKMRNDAVSVAVVIQKMIQSEISGISFTVHPVTKNPDQMIIEAGYGLGEAIVGGIITPDNYTINKEKITIADKYISDQNIMIIKTPDASTKEIAVADDLSQKQKLSDDKILELSKICLNIEKHYCFPCDIEWVLENNQLHIVQSRPITTL